MKKALAKFTQLWWHSSLDSSFRWTKLEELANVASSLIFFNQNRFGICWKWTAQRKLRQMLPVGILVGTTSPFTDARVISMGYNKSKKWSLCWSHTWSYIPLREIRPVFVQASPNLIKLEGIQGVVFVLLPCPVSGIAESFWPSNECPWTNLTPLFCLLSLHKLQPKHLIYNWKFAGNNSIPIATQVESLEKR